MALAERAAADAGLLRADVGARVDEIDELRRGADLRDERHRRTQGAEPEPEPEIGRNVTEMKSDGSKDAEAWREKDTGGPRRLQANKCSGPELASHTNAIAVECCDEPTEDCSDGYPHTCNAGCAGLLLPFWDDCRAALGKESSQFEGTVALCAPPPPPAPAAGVRAAQTFSRVCTSANLATCVPTCDATVSEFMLHIEIDGQGTAMTCNKYDGTFSWQGLASLGGCVSADSGAFFSSVNSEAPPGCTSISP